jgi:hypothetical protein
MLKFLNVFNRREVDHPMATVAEAKAILDGLLGTPAVEVIEECTNWLASLCAMDGFPCDTRLAVVKEIDEASRKQAGIVLSEHFAHLRQRDRAQRKLFDTLHLYWTGLASAYERCASDFDQALEHAARVRNEMPLVFVRFFRASGCVARLQYLRYQELGTGFWVGLARDFAVAERRKFDEIAVVPYPKEVHSTARGELLKIFGLYLAAPHELPMEDINLAYRIIDRFAASFAWSLEPSDVCNFCTDLAMQARPWQRDSKEQPSDSRRHFGGGPALAKLEEIERLCNANLLSDETRFGDDFAPERIVTVIRHLRTYLGASPPKRHFPREAVNTRVSIIRGFHPICQRVTAIEIGAGAAIHDDLNVEVQEKAAVQLQAEKIESEPEAWQLLDRSEWGMAASVPPGLGQWAEPGVLCGIQEQEGAHWWVGIIRRMQFDDTGCPRCGFWIMSKKPVSVWLRILGGEGQKADNWESSTGSFSFTYLRAIILSDALRINDRQVIILEPKGFVSNNLCELMLGERARMIQLSDLLECGADYVRATFDWYRPQK